MRRSLILSAGLALSACSPSAPDGYRYEQTEFERDQVAVIVVAHPSEADLKRAAERLGVDAGEGRDLMAFGIVRANGCTIHIVEPARSYRPEWIGHEFTHCIRGRWHG